VSFFVFFFTWYKDVRFFGVFYLVCVWCFELFVDDFERKKKSVFRSKTIEVFSNTPYQTKRGFNAGDLQCVILVILLNLKKSICETIRWSGFFFFFFFFWFLIHCYHVSPWVLWMQLVRRIFIVHPFKINVLLLAGWFVRLPFLWANERISFLFEFCFLWTVSR
jgi:hypothetical protein